MKNILNKVSIFLLVLTIGFTSCDSNDTNFEIISPEAEFTLEQPGISTVFLNFSLPNNNAITMVWNDDVTGATSYDIEMSTDAEFTSPIAVGSSQSNTFSLSVSELNTIITNTGTTNFRDVPMYARVKSGDTVSNTVLYLVTTYPVEAPTFDGLANGDAFVLTIANNDAIATTISWVDPVLDSGLFNIEYTVEAATPNTSFAAPIELAKVTDVNSVDLLTSTLNRVAQESGILPDTTGDLDVRVKSVITDPNTGMVLERINDAVTITVTTYLTVLDLSTTWGVVGSAANNWGATPDLPFWKTDVDGVLAAYVNLIDGEIKFRENNDWANNLGDNGADGTLEQGGANIAVTAGSYKITMDLNNSTYTIEPFSLGIVGSGYNNWGATPDFMLEYDQYSDVFRGIVTLLDGEIKFRMNNDWGTNWGDNGADGTLELNGANIQSTAGIYIVTVDMNDNTYEFEQISSVWGLVGSAYNNWGATPDASFERDWSKPFDDAWILRDVTLLDGEYKIRANNDWGTNYGDNGADGTLELNGANIQSVAGTYTITLDFSDPANPTYTIQ